MPINRDTTRKRNLAADERRVKGTGAATGGLGQVFLTQQTTRLTKYLEKVLAKHPTARKREIESLTPEVFDALRGIPKATIANAMLCGVINCHPIVGQDAPPRVWTAMGDELQVEARGVAVRKALGPKEYARLRKALSRKASMYKKLQVEQMVLRKHAITVDPWPRALQSRVGIFAGDMLLRALPDVIVLDKHKIPRIAEQAWEAFEINLYANPIYEPSAEPPFPWFGFDGIDGDTFVAACRDERAVRVAIAGGIPHVDAVNYLQATGFRINERALEVVKDARARLLLKKVKDDGAETLLEQNIAMADRFVGKPLYVPLRVDFRGRLIAAPNLNFTAPDHIRGLFKFDKTAPLTESGLYWLKIACATSFNEEKEVARQTFAKRLAWADSNLERICRAGRNPLDHLTWLEEAADPIQCVAIFAELANAIESGLGYACTIPIGFDASCSGLQHFALLARDSQTARLTNLTPSDEGPWDIYDYIRRHVQKALTNYPKEGELARWWLDSRLDRKIIKQLVMTYGYSAKEWGQKSGVYNALRRRGENIPDGAVAFLVKLVRKAIETHIPAAKKVMDNLQALVSEDAPVCWVSPSGLPVANSYQKPRTSRVRLYLLGHSPRSKISIGWQPEQRFSKAESAIAPNYIHSLDAAHLVRVANACARHRIPVVTIHDSYSTLPPYADRLREILLEELRDMYATYKSLVRPTGDLDFNEVTGDYAFS
jgi:DNA-dependent RNA polymerase